MISETDSSSPNAGPRVRFAPAPTGYLHLGGARTALFNWLYARHHGGRFILRIEDTDLQRSRSEVLDQVLEALRWLGLEWDEGPDIGGDCGPYFQAERKELHLEHARKLLESGRAYECYMTPEEIDRRRRKAMAEGRPFRYEGWHRDLTSEQIAAFRAEGRKPAIRLRVDPPRDGHVVDDLIKGPTHFPPEQIDDFILVRSDGAPSFHLANVVDDALMRISHVIRGEDHLTNTIRHQALFDALGYAKPRYAHLPMILGPDRSKLSKRHGAVSVMEYKDAGYLPEALVNELALLGWSPADGQERLTTRELIERFDLDRCGHSGSIFDAAKLDHFNGLLIREMALDQLIPKLEPWSSRLPDLSPENQKALVDLLQDSIERLADFPALARRVLDAPSYAEDLISDDAMGGADKVLELAVGHFGQAESAWERSAIKKAIKAVGKEAGVKGKALFFPVRAALTGSLHGPPLDGVMAVLGRAECLKRFKAMAQWLREREDAGMSSGKG